MSNKSIKLAIPGLWTHLDTMKKIIEFIEYYPEAVRDNFTIGAVYDNFPYCIWDGGRIFTSINYASLEEIVETKEYFNSKNIPVRLIFTNPELRPEHLSDRFCNLVSHVCEDPLNEIVVNSAILEDHLRANYPEYGYISSTTKCNILDESLKEINADQYKYICLDYNQNHNFVQLNNLTQEEKDQVEFLCNAICPPGCPSRKEHYRLNGLYYLSYMRQYHTAACRIKTPINHPATRAYANTISPEDIETIYAPKGFSMFKLEGRTLSANSFLLNVVYYLIKPEYQFYCLEAIMDN